MFYEIEHNLLENRGVLAVVDQGYPDENQGLLKRQLHGERLLFLGQEDVLRLTAGISTDGILPTKGGRFQKPEDLAPFALSGVPGIPEKAIESGEFGVLVVGNKFGGGSAREHAPRSLKGANVKVVVVLGTAERIFKENCLFAGGPLVVEIPPDMNEINRLLGQIHSEGVIRVPEPYMDPIRPLIRDCGGLFAFTRKRLAGEIELPIISHRELPIGHPMTAAQKILAQKMINIDPQHRVVRPGDTGFVGTDFRFTYDLHTKMLHSLLEEHFGSEATELIQDKDSIAAFEDHSVLAHLIGERRFIPLIDDQRVFSRRLGLRLFNDSAGLGGSEGICHTLIVEKGMVLPGEVLVGSDSHTCSAGVLGAYAEGVGATALANAFITKDIFVEVPQSIRVRFRGKLPKGSTTKDVMLSILADPYIKLGNGIGKVIEYTNFEGETEGIHSFSLDELFVLTNMAIEGGLTTGIIAEPTDAVLSHLKKVTGRSYTELLERFVRADRNAEYAYELEIDLSQIDPMVALPGNPSNGVPLSTLSQTTITSAYIGSCTGGNISDLRQVADTLRDKRIKVPLFVQAASITIHRMAEEEGLFDVIRQAGGQIFPPGCGACIGMGPGKIMSASDVIISDTNRNFPGRMGKPQNAGEEIEGGSVYLASPAVVAASSVTGYISSPLEI